MSERELRMDGLPHTLTSRTATSPLGFSAASGMQRTLKAPIGCVGVGLHSGRRITLRLAPAAADTGIVFRRTDLGIDIPARFDHVVDTRLCTVLGLDGSE